MLNHQFSTHIGFLILCITICVSCTSHKFERQITFDLSKNHDLDNNDNFSPDDKWLAYDTRTANGGIGGCRSIEKVNIGTGEIETLYQPENASEYGPGVGAVSYSPVDNKVVFIHGLFNCNSDRPYEQWRRTGVVIDESEPRQPIFVDARDITPPFTPGALRGGTHRHEWSADGQWLGFTYNDAIMKAIEDRTGERRNLRTIGISHNFHPVQVDKDANGENNNGEWFSVLVVRVVPNPEPGSDEIEHAADDSWVGTKGYIKPDDTYQRSRAFLGTVRNAQGDPVKEVFIVDIPDRIDVASDAGPLQGTETTLPMPPRGASQRRLTFTAESKYPGCSTVVRSSPDGSRIAFVAKNQDGVDQIFFISPLGGKAEQVTHHHSSVQSGVRWHPNGSWICYVWDNSVMVCDVRTGGSFGRFKRMTPKTDQPPFNLVWSHNGKWIAYNRYVPGIAGSSLTKQIFVLEF